MLFVTVEGLGAKTEKNRPVFILGIYRRSISPKVL